MVDNMYFIDPSHTTSPNSRVYIVYKNGSKKDITDDIHTLGY
jgi:hypothetical protein